MSEFQPIGEGLYIISYDRRIMLEALYVFNVQNEGAASDPDHLKQFKENMTLLESGFFRERGLAGKILSLKGQNEIRIPINYSLFNNFTYFNALSIDAFRNLKSPEAINKLGLQTTRYIEKIASAL